MGEILLAGLEPGRQYAIELRARLEDGYSEWSPRLLITTPQSTLTPKPPPTAVAEESGQSFLLTWTAPIENTDDSPLLDLMDYRVTVSSNGTSRTYYTSALRFDFTEEMNRGAFGVMRGDITFGVAARNRRGLVSTDRTASITNGAPLAPSGLQAKDGRDVAHVMWYRGEEDVVEYEVYAGNTTGFTPAPGNLVWTGTANVATIPLAVGTWYFKVRAIDMFGNEGAYTDASNAANVTSAAGYTPDTTAPANPSGFTATPSVYRMLGLQRARISLTWTAPTVAGTPDLAGFYVRYRKSGDTNWIVDTIDGSQNYYQFNNLDFSTTYEFEVQAFDDSGNTSGNGTTSQATGARTEPDEIQNVTRIPAGGALQSTPYSPLANPPVGWQLSENEFVMFSGSINLGTNDDGFFANDLGEIWTGGPDFTSADWRVAKDGRMRVGGTDTALNIDPDGNIWSGHATRTSAPWNITAAGLATFNNVVITDTNAPANTARDIVNVSNDIVIHRHADNSVGMHIYGGHLTLDEGGNIDVLADGDINIATGNLNLFGTGSINMSGGALNMTAGNFNITGGNINMSNGTFELSGGAIESSNYSSTTQTGFQIDGATGDAAFYGATLSATSITAADIPAATLGTYTFEADTVGSAPSGWSVHTGTAGRWLVNSTSPASGSTKHLRYTRGTTTEEGTWLRATQTFATDVVISYKFRTSELPTDRGGGTWTDVTDNFVGGAYLRSTSGSSRRGWVAGLSGLGNAGSVFRLAFFNSGSVDTQYGTDYITESILGWTFAINTWYRVKFRVHGRVVSFKVWRDGVDTEPVSYQRTLSADVYDSDPTDNVVVGLMNAFENSTSQSYNVTPVVDYDDVVIATQPAAFNVDATGNLWTGSSTLGEAPVFLSNDGKFVSQDAEFRIEIQSGRIFWDSLQTPTVGSHNGMVNWGSLTAEMRYYAPWYDLQFEAGLHFSHDTGWEFALSYASMWKTQHLDIVPVSGGPDRFVSILSSTTLGSPSDDIGGHGVFSIGADQGDKLAFSQKYIQARAYAANAYTAGPLGLNFYGGNVELFGAAGTDSNKLLVRSSASANSLNNDSGILVLGASATAAQMALGSSSIQARANGASATLNLNPQGGDITVANSSGNPSLYLRTTQGSTTTANTGGVVIGTSSGAQLGLDFNSVVARAAGGGATTLGINNIADTGASINFGPTDASRALQYWANAGGSRPVLRGHATGVDSALRWGDTGLLVRTRGDGAYTKISATVFDVQTSSRSTKTDFSEIDALSVIKKAHAQKWRYKKTIQPNDQRYRVGPVADDLPDEFTIPDETSDARGLDLSSLVGLLWRATEQQEAEIEALRRELAALQER